MSNNPAAEKETEIPHTDPIRVGASLQSNSLAVTLQPNCPAWKRAA
jgi:hypothetical protein